MEQLDRISRMEQALDEATEAVNALNDALERYEAVQNDLRQLSDYYGSPLWQQDLSDDQSGKLPQDAKRGVLSEDAVYDLLCARTTLKETFRVLADLD